MSDSNCNPSVDLEKRIMDIMTSNPKGISQSTLQSSLPNINVAEFVKILNNLISQGKINLLKKGNQLVYVWKNDTGSKKLQGTDVEEKLLFEAIKRAGNNGVSARELKFQCNMPQPQITKVLKSLEARKLIKSVTSVTKKKVFMLYELEPSATVTGGTFYSGEDFEAEFVNVLGDHIYRYLVHAKGTAEKLLDPISQKRASFKSATEICEYINGTKISKVELQMADIEKIIQSLIYDGKVQESVIFSKGSDPKNYYAASKSMLTNVGLMRLPCGVCLVFQECGKDREVSPATCEYMKEWMDF